MKLTGYVKDQIEELQVMCEASYLHDSSLECSKYLRYVWTNSIKFNPCTVKEVFTIIQIMFFRFCRGRNLMLNFTGLVGRGDNLRYKMDILSEGQIGEF